jgi:hypothetical protein
MDAVVEWYRLRGRGWRGGCRTHTSYGEENGFHRFDVRICSAMYSDARIDNDRIVIVGF